VGAISGITTGNGNASVSTSGALTVNSAVNAGTGTVALTGSSLQGGGVNGQSVTLTATGGAIGTASTPFIADSAQIGADSTGMLTAQITNTSVSANTSGALTLYGIGATSGSAILGTIDLTAASIANGIAGNSTDAAKLALIGTSVTLSAPTGTIGSNDSPMTIAANQLNVTASSSGESVIVVANEHGNIGQGASPIIPNATVSGRVDYLLAPWNAVGTEAVLGSTAIATPFEASSFAAGSIINTTAGTTAKSLQFDIAEAANSLVSLFDLVEPRVCLPPDQLEEESPSIKGCVSKTGAKTARIGKRRAPVSSSLTPKTPPRVTMNNVGDHEQPR
jgi:hypothetical protein